MTTSIVRPVHIHRAADYGLSRIKDGPLVECTLIKGYLTEVHHAGKCRNTRPVCAYRGGAGAVCLCIPGRPVDSGLALGWPDWTGVARNRIFQKLPDLSGVGHIDLPGSPVERHPID